MKVEACCLCGGEMHPVLTVESGFALASCAACGLVSTVPALGEDEILAYYPPAYFGRRNQRFNALFEWLIRVFRERRARLIERRTRRGRMLDVGCGRGLLPYLMRLRGWETHGIEVSETAAEHARDVLGVGVFIGSVEQSPYPDGYFDAVVFWHVLEHIRDPRSALQRARHLLAPHGLLIVAVPNFESLQARVGSRGWFHLDVPRHFHHFGLTVLRRLLTDEGFEVELVSHFALEQNPYGWVQSLLNRLGFRHNLLYEILKSDSARAEARPLRSHPVQFVLMLLALVGIVPLSGMLFVAELLMRRGGTVEVCARRRALPDEAPTP